MEINKKAIGERLKEIRIHEPKSTQKEFAKLIGTTQQKLSHYENGRNPIPYELLCKYIDIAQAKGMKEVMADWLLFGKQPDQVAEPSELDQKYREADSKIKGVIDDLLELPHQEEKKTPIPMYEQVTADEPATALKTAYMACGWARNHEDEPIEKNRLQNRQLLIEEWFEAKTGEKVCANVITVSEIYKVAS